MVWIHTIYDEKWSSLSRIAYMMPGIPPTHSFGRTLSFHYIWAHTVTAKYSNLSFTGGEMNNINYFGFAVENECTYTDPTPKGC